MFSAFRSCTFRRCVPLAALKRVEFTRVRCGSSAVGKAKDYAFLVKVVQGSAKLPQPQYQRASTACNRYGEDSWFISTTPKAEVMGVADGVGGWRSLGIDSGVFAKELMYCCSNNAQRPEFDGRNPRQLLIKSFNQLKAKTSKVQGSSTACLVALKRSDCTLHTANLGDSGFLVLRGGKVVHRSYGQQHSFNTPYQLTVPLNKHQSGDEPELAIATHMPLQEGDLVLTATDGLFDNVAESLLVRQLSNSQGETRAERLQVVANKLVALARSLSNNASYQSPFAMKAKAHNMNYSSGGKPDDITLILASVAVPRH